MAETTRIYSITKKRRPRVEVELRSADPIEYASRSGIRITISRDGLDLFGWYDSLMGIEGFTIPWSEFDELREYVMRKGNENG